MLNGIWMTPLAASCLLLGCPGDADPNATAAEFFSTYAGAYAAAAGAKSHAAAGAMAEPPPPPDIKKLCSLQFGRTSFDAAKKLFGTPEDESMDKSKAGISYRYKGKQGAVTMTLTFDWSDGDVGWGTKIFGIGGDVEDLIQGYLLSEASITGMPYPACWPHDEP